MRDTFNGSYKTYRIIRLRFVILMVVQVTSLILQEYFITRILLGQ